MIVGLALSTTPAWAWIQVGEEYTAHIDTPQDYKGGQPGQMEIEWSYELYHPGATYIAIHFVDFELAPGDFLSVSDAAGKQYYTMEEQGKMNAGEFWARHILGDTVMLELYKVNPQGGRGFKIDKYAAGFMNMGDPHSRAICGTDDKENAVCYQTSHPTEYDKGRAVCRLWKNGTGNCTGWVVSAEGHILTNEHCIGSQSEATNSDFDFMAEAPTCGTTNCQNCYPGTIYSGGTLIMANAGLDFSLLEIPGVNAASQFGYLELDNRVAIPGEEIYIIGHPGARAKEFTIYSTHPNDPNGIATVYSITEPPCSGSGYNDVGYYADTEGGSSGSAVLARSSHKVIALHHCANCPNRGVPIHLIYPLIASYLTPGPAGTVELDKDLYGCDDTVMIEVRDGDLLGMGTQAVTVASSGGDIETVMLSETGASTGIFTGGIDTTDVPGMSGDGVLQVGHGQTLSVTYIDADDGNGNYNVPVSDSASVDCQPPVISSVQTTNIEPRSAVVEIAADELVAGPSTTAWPATPSTARPTGPASPTRPACP